jgi:nucleotide-binding universal stress UspA family protein
VRVMALPLVVGVDGTDFSLRAVDWAVAEAARGPYRLRLVHALLGDDWDSYSPSRPWRYAHRRPDRLLGEEILDTAAARAAAIAPHVPVLTHLADDLALPALLREGREAAMVVVGRRGRGDIAGMLLGSVSLGLAARASCPVVVVRGGDPGAEGRPEGVTLGVSGAWHDAAAVRFAFREAERRGCELRAVHCHSGTPSHGRKPEEVLDDVLCDDAAMHPGVVVVRESLQEPARRALLRHSEETGLLVVGARRQRGHLGLQLGLLSHTMLHHARCPVAVVPRPSS